MHALLTILDILFGVSAATVLVRSAWLLFRGDYKRGAIHVAIGLLAFGIALAFHFAKNIFQAGG